MNYRHSYHAGNFADLVKHSLLLELMGALRPRGPLSIIDTHAGAGLYDLEAGEARSLEAEAGVARLMASEARPPEIERLAAEVAAMNPEGGLRWYPGSPVLAARGLGPEDRYLGFELRDDVREMLVESLAPHACAEARGGDGYDQAVAAARDVANALVLIDPPYERPDDYVRSAETAIAVVRAAPDAVVAIWCPLKDLETFDGFIRRLDGVKPGGVLAAEARLRPLTNPMKMNGCAMVVVNAPADLDAAAGSICGWVAQTLGDPGGRGEVWRL